MPFYIVETLKKGVYYNDCRPDDGINNCTHYSKTKMLRYYDTFTSVNYKVKRVNDDGSTIMINNKRDL